MQLHDKKLKSLQEKMEKLAQSQSKLIEKRKQSIANLAERFELIKISDAILMGIFSEVQLAIKHNSNKIKAWELMGERFRRSKRSNIKTAEPDYKPDPLFK